MHFHLFDWNKFEALGLQIYFNQRDENAEANCWFGGSQPEIHMIHINSMGSIWMRLIIQQHIALRRILEHQKVGPK